MTDQNSSLQKVLSSRFYIGTKIPDSSSELSQRLSAALVDIVGPAAKTAASVHATITAPPAIHLIEADLSGLTVELGEKAAEAAKNKVSTDVTNEADRLPSLIDKVMVKAHPLKVDGVPAEFDLQVEHVPFNWVTDKDGEVWFAVDDPRSGNMTGELSAHVTNEALHEGVRRAVAAGAEQNGFKLLDLDFDLRQSGDDFFVVGHAKLKKGILAAKAEAKAVAHYDPKTLQLTVKELQIHSANPAVAMILRMADGQIAQYRGKTIDLNEKLAPSGYQLQTLTIEVTQAGVRLHGKF